MSTLAIVIPCYKVKDHILRVLHNVPESVHKIYIVDDACPQKSGEHAAAHWKDERLHVLFHEQNMGVGAAVITGYRQAALDGMDIVVKVDGDDQMDLQYIPTLIQPIIEGQADYVKGNRFYSYQSLHTMPTVRLLGNATLSFVNKLSSGYWNIMDPANGFTAIHIALITMLPLEKIEKRYFFESDMLYHLSLLRAKVMEIPMFSRYADERSSLNVANVLLTFPQKYLIRFLKRIFYNYFLRDFNICSLELIFGLILFTFGAMFGGIHWYLSITSGVPATSGTVMLAGVPTLLGVQLLLSALSYDVANVPKSVVAPYLKKHV